MQLCRTADQILDTLVHHQAAPTRTYNPRAAAYGKPAQAMVFNSVV